MNPKTQKLKDVLGNFKNALASLENAANRDTNDAVIVAGIVQHFEFVYELGWICMKRVLEEGGHTTGMARDVFSKAYQLGLISDEKSWLKIIEDRNLTTHTYDQVFAKEMVKRIINIYLPMFQKLRALFDKSK